MPLVETVLLLSGNDQTNRFMFCTTVTEPQFLQFFMKINLQMTFWSVIAYY